MGRPSERFMSAKKVTIAARKAKTSRRIVAKQPAAIGAAPQKPLVQAAERQRSKPAHNKRLTKVVPDSVDLRDRPYTPAVQIVPATELYPSVTIPVLDQGQTNACTGF